jgi:isopentenyl-diphosphate Delta-isomerase
MAKLDAHQAPGRRHLAFSVLLRDAAGKVLLQRRALGKYHFPGVWANSCCSHPRPGEDPTRSAHRRISEELGVDVGALTASAAFWYRARDPASGLVEFEYDLVFQGELVAPATLDPDPAEISDLRWLAPATALEQLHHERAAIAPWLPPVLRMFAARSTRPLS